MKVLITGANGFLGRNLRVRLAERKAEVATFTRDDPVSDLPGKLRDVDFVFHLAGVNRPEDPADFDRVNAGLTQALCEALRVHASEKGRRVPIAYTSSSQAALDNLYGASKRAAETALNTLASQTGAPVYLLRLTNVFGKWCRPHYNSVVATFCHEIARGRPITINDPEAELRLVYVDDVVDTFLRLLDGGDGVETDADGLRCVRPEYTTTVGELASTITSFRESRRSLVIPRVGNGMIRALYSTYLSHLPTDSFVYDIPLHTDARGSFVEMLKTEDSGQFSYFTALPGMIRGSHYHHTKTEKFLVIKGTARFGFRHILTDERQEVLVRGGEGRVVETVPGWTHDIANVGEDELLVMLWANEIFDRNRPDTVACKV